MHGSNGLARPWKIVDCPTAWGRTREASKRENDGHTRGGLCRAEQRTHRCMCVEERSHVLDEAGAEVVSWLGTGVAKLQRSSASEPMVRWKSAHP